MDNFEISVNEKRHSVRPEVYLDNTEHLIKNLDDERATTLGRTAVRVLTRTIAAQQAKKAMETNNIFLNLLTSIGTDVAAGQLEQADLRVAIFLPHVVRVARIPAKPGTHTVKVIATDRNGGAVKNYTYTVNVKARGKAFVVVPAIR